LVQQLREALHLVDAHPASGRQMTDAVREGARPDEQVLVERLVEQIEAGCLGETLPDPSALSAPARAEDEEALPRRLKQARQLLGDDHFDDFRRKLTAMSTGQLLPERSPRGP